MRSGPGKMIKKIIHTMILGFFLLSRPAYSQDCEVPEPPVLRRVSVDPQTGRVALEWSSSPSSGISGYIIYWNDNDNNGWMALADTIWNPSATSYEYTTSGTKYQSMDFRVAAYRSPLVQGRPGCPSKLSNALSTIFLMAEADTCNGRISLKWNRYSDILNPVTEYNVLISVNDGSFVESYTLGPASDNYVITDFQTDSEYSFFISASLMNGISTSYRSNASTYMRNPPGWINADYASFEENHINLSFTSDPLSEIRLYSLERRSDNGSWTRLTEINSVSNIILYTDNQVDKGEIYYYRLSAINGCNKQVSISNTTSNIVTAASKPGNDIFLVWNNPGRLTDSRISYEIFVNKGNGLTHFANTSDTLYFIKPSDIFYDVSSGEVCFEVEASESNNIHGINSTIRSSSDCLNLPVLVTVPNVFTPDNDLKNDLFSPILSFTPAEYLLLITDKQGKELFETRDHVEKWDGTSGGRLLPEGVYLWYLRLIAPSGEVISRTGTITIIR